MKLRVKALTPLKAQRHRYYIDIENELIGIDRRYTKCCIVLKTNHFTKKNRLLVGANFLRKIAQSLIIVLVFAKQSLLKSLPYILSTVYEYLSMTYKY